jgi:hypothetical protein
MSFTLYVRYSKALGRPNTCLYVAELETFRCRLQVGGGAEVSPVDIHVRFRGRGPALGLVHCRMVDGHTAQLESARLHEDMPYRIELVVTQIPEDVGLLLLAL